MKSVFWKLTSEIKYQIGIILNSKGLASMAFFSIKEKWKLMQSFFFEGLTLNRIAKIIDLSILFLLVRLCGETRANFLLPKIMTIEISGKVRWQCLGRSL